jgi:hypothetical protein
METTYDQQAALAAVGGFVLGGLALHLAVTVANAIWGRSTGRGPWCVALDRGIWGYQIVYEARWQKACTKWRTRHRTFYPHTLYVLPRRRLDAENSALVASPEYWMHVNNLADRPFATYDRRPACPEQRTEEMPIVPSTFRIKGFTPEQEGRVLTMEVESVLTAGLLERAEETVAAAEDEAAEMRIVRQRVGGVDGGS